MIRETVDRSALVAGADAAGLSFRRDPRRPSRGDRPRSDRRRRGRRGGGPGAADRRRQRGQSEGDDRAGPRRRRAAARRPAGRCPRRPGLRCAPVRSRRSRHGMRRRDPARGEPGRALGCRCRAARADRRACSARSAPATSACISRRAIRAGAAPRPTGSCAMPPTSCARGAAPSPRSMSRSSASGRRSRPHRAAMVERVAEILGIAPGPRQRQGDDDREARLHRPRRRHRRAGRRHGAPAALTLPLPATCAPLRCLAKRACARRG